MQPFSLTIPTLTCGCSAILNVSFLEFKRYPVPCFLWTCNLLRATTAYLYATVRMVRQFRPSVRLSVRPSVTHTRSKDPGGHGFEVTPFRLWTSTTTNLLPRFGHL